MESSFTTLSMRSIPGGVNITSPGLQIPALRDGKAETEGIDWRSIRSIHVEHWSYVTCQRGKDGTYQHFTSEIKQYPVGCQQLWHWTLCNAAVDELSWEPVQMRCHGVAKKSVQKTMVHTSSSGSGVMAMI